jgi:hypothetical protein
MSLDSAISIQKVDSDDSIVACQQDAADFFDSIDPKRTSSSATMSPTKSGIGRVDPQDRTSQRSEPCQVTRKGATFPTAILIV